MVALALAAGGAAAWALHPEPVDYRHFQPYVGTLWIPLYLLVRNCTPWLMHRVAAPMEWIGMHSLEFYLLQFHVFLTRKSQKILYIIPNEDWGYTNMVIVGFIYVRARVVTSKMLRMVVCGDWLRLRRSRGVDATR